MLYLKKELATTCTRAPYDTTSSSFRFRLLLCSFHFNFNFNFTSVDGRHASVAEDGFERRREFGRRRRLDQLSGFVLSTNHERLFVRRRN